MTSERRRSRRFPVTFYIHQIINDEPFRCFITDLSPMGLYAERPFAQLARNTDVVQVELPLPNTSESLWTRGEVVYDRLDGLFHGSAVRFTAMARKHQRMLREWLRESQRPGLVVGRHPARRAPRVSILRPGSQVPIAA